MSRLPVYVGSVFCLALPLGLSPAGQPGDSGGAGRADDRLPAGAVARLGTARFLNLGRVFTVAFAPDGKTLVTGAWDGSMRLWQVAPARELRAFAGHEGAVHSVAFAPDGKLVASAGKDRDIRLWEAATGKLLRRLAGHKGGVTAVAFSPDGKVLGSSSWDETVLWDAATGRQLHRSTREQRGVKADDPDMLLAFSPDLKAAAFLGIDGSVPTDWGYVIRLRETATGKEFRQFAVPRRWWVQNAAFSPDGKTLALGAGFSGYLHAIRLWDVDTGNELRPMVFPAGQQSYVNAIAFSPDGRLLASAGGGDTICIWEVATRRQGCSFQDPEAGKTCLAFSPDGRLLASGSTDITAFLWDVTGRLQGGRLRPVRLRPDELRAAWDDLQSEDAPRARRALWTLVAAGGQSIPVLQAHLQPVACPFSPEAVARLAGDLNSDQFGTRTRATEQLEKLGELAESALREALGRRPSLETRQRIMRLLKRLAEERSMPSAGRLGTLRAVEVLEHIGTPEVRPVLQGLARGAPGATLTEEAKAALGRLGRRSSP